MSVQSYQTKKGKKWLFFARDAEKRLVKKSGFKTKHEAQEAERRFLMQYKVSSNHSFWEFYELNYIPYITNVKKLRISTVDTIKSAFTTRFKKEFGDKELSSFTPMFFNLYLQRQIKERSESYAANSYMYLHAFFAYVERMLDLKNPLDKIDKPQSPLKYSPRWSIDEFKRAMNIMNTSERPSYHYYKHIFELLYLTGCRIGEILALTPDDVVCENNIYKLKINKTFNSKNEITLIHTKNHKDREVFINQDLYDKIKRFVDEHEISDNERIFKKTENATLRFLKDFCDREQLKKVTLHSFRKAHVSYLILKNMNPAVAADRLGHSTKVMFDYYVKVKQNKEEIENLLDELQK